MDFSHWGASPNARASTLFDAIVSALGAFNFLGAQREVNPQKLCITGTSLGGYATILLSGLLDTRVQGAISLFGSGYFLEGSAWQGSISALPEAAREEWISNLDAGTRAHRIRAPMLFYAAANDTFFHLPAILKTIDSISGAATYVSFEPNENHSFTLPGGISGLSLQPWTTVEPLFILNQIEAEKTALPKFWRRPRNGKVVNIEPVGLPSGASGSVYYSTNLNVYWPSRVWNRLEMKSSPSGLTATFPYSVAVADWFASFSFDYDASALNDTISLSTTIYRDDFSQ